MDYDFLRNGLDDVSMETCLFHDLLTFYSVSWL